MVHGPHFEDEFLEDVAAAFRKRRKSLSHQAARAEFSKVYEKMRTEETARLEIDLVDYDKTSLRLWAWPERLVWLDARQPTKKGWAWSWNHEGRLFGGRSARDIIAALEDTYFLMQGMDAAHVASLNRPWRPMFAHGPKAVK